MSCGPYFLFFDFFYHLFVPYLTLVLGAALIKQEAHKRIIVHRQRWQAANIASRKRRKKGSRIKREEEMIYGLHGSDVSPLKLVFSKYSLQNFPPSTAFIALQTPDRLSKCLITSEQILLWVFFTGPATFDIPNHQIFDRHIFYDIFLASLLVPQKILVRLIMITMHGKYDNSDLGTEQRAKFLQQRYFLFLTNVFHKIPSFIFGISFVVVFAYISQLYATPLIVIG